LNEGELAVGNIEMETAGLYGLGKLFNFEVISINAILAHRLDGSFSDCMDKTVETMIVKALDIICDDAN
jgi:uridine phosphorylase